MSYVVYVLRSKKDKKRYIGFTNNIERRIRQHNSGSVVATKKRIPLIIEYTEEYESKLEAIKQERYFKTAAGRRFLDRVCAGGEMADTIV